MKVRKKLLALVGGICLTVVLVALPFRATCPAPARPEKEGASPTKPVELSLNLIIPKVHPRYQQITKPWIEKLEERAGGRLKITPYFSGALSPIKENYESVVKGVADMGVCFFSVTRYWPLSQLIEVPYPTRPTCEGNSSVLWHLYETFPEVRAEWEDVKVLGFTATPPFYIWLTKNPVRSLKDLKGLKIRTGGSFGTPIAEALGFSPVKMGMGDLYSGLEKGVVDGCMVPVDAVVGRKVYEVVKYCTEVELGLAAFFWVMNKDTWDNLPPDIKKVFDDLSGAWLVDFAGKTYDKIAQEDRKILIAKGIEFISVSPEEKARWEERLKTVASEYATKLDAKGKPGTKVLSELLRQAAAK